MFGNNSQIEVKKRRSPSSLRSICAKSISDNYSKNTLNIILLEYEWVSALDTWKSDNCPKYELGNQFDFEIDWFSKPCYDGNQLRFHFTDASHLLTCLRTKLCTTGISGLRIQAWEDAALSTDTNLNISLIVECIDKQSVAFAKSVFAPDVQSFMLRNGFKKEASFCQCVSDWFDAEDSPGLSAMERCRRRIKMRDWLLRDVDFGQFPPKGNYINGIPATTYEALIVHIERNLQISAHCKSGYNVRTTGTQEVEQFFSTFRDLDPSGCGTPKPDDIPMMMARAADITNCKFDPNRTFHMTTSKATVYPEVTYSQSTTTSEGSGNWKNVKEKGLVIDPSDHFFDTEERQRVSRRKKKSGTVTSPGKPARGQQGVRQFHRVDETKIAAHHRRGLFTIPV